MVRRALAMSLASESASGNSSANTQGVIKGLALPMRTLSVVLVTAEAGFGLAVSLDQGAEPIRQGFMLEISELSGVHEHAVF